ncbi:MAG: peptidoglycan D,D-transpeptidase FtsI family protein [Candidatus Aminicenantia bacterium]
MIKSPVNKLKKRTKIGFVIFLGWAILIFLRLVDLQILRHKTYRKLVLAQNSRLFSVDPKRGNIYDRNGKILATSVKAHSIYIVPSLWEGREEELKKLCNYLNLSLEDFERLIEGVRNKKQFIWVKRKISVEEGERLLALNLKNVGIYKEFKRVYPEGELAAHILGGVGVDEQGLDGIEYFYNSTLSGSKGKIWVYRDGKRVPQYYQVAEVIPPKPGKDIILTIDKNIQFITDLILENWVKRWVAKGGVAIVIDPKNGEIIALSSYPRYDVNDFCKVDENSKINRAIRWIYEPGSTIKVPLSALVFESGKVKLNEVFDCRGGRIELYNLSIKDHKNFSFLSFPEIIKYSSNVGAIKLALRMNEKELFFNLKEKFKFSKRTGIDLPGEERGIFRLPSQWSKISIGSIAIGQEIGVTPIQVLRAISAVANNGFMVTPHVLKKMRRGDREESIIFNPPERVISARTASIMKRIMEMVVEDGTGKKAYIEGVKVAGKTGTAQKIVNGRYSESLHVSSFVGFFPSDKPLYSIIVVIDEPKGIEWGGEVAAPVFKEIALGIIRLKGWEIFNNIQLANLKDGANENQGFASKD